MKRGVSAAEIDERRIKVAKLWREGHEAKQIAAMLGVTLHQVNYDASVLQAEGVITTRHPHIKSRHRVMKTHGRPNYGRTPEDRRLRKAEAYARECAGHANAKRVLTVADQFGETRILRFFANQGEARNEPRDAIIGQSAGRVTRDEIYVINPVSGHKRWALLEGCAS